MRIPMVCRSCGETEIVNLATAPADGKVVCPLCEHEASLGDTSQRQSILSQQAKTQTLSRIGGGCAAGAVTLVAARLFFMGAEGTSASGAALWSAAALLFLGAAACMVLAEQNREVVHF